jgi:hypothetical protein
MRRITGVATSPSSCECEFLPSSRSPAPPMRMTSCPLPGGILGNKEEVPMFEMINEEKPSPERRKIFLTKAAFFLVAVVLVAGVIYFLAFTK